MATGIAYGELLIAALGIDPPFGPCRWPADYTCVDLTTEQAAVTGNLVDGATELLWALSGRQFGECAVVLRPCRRECASTYPADLMASDLWPHPAKIDGEWLNLACGSCGTSCSCTEVEQVVLPSPVTRVVQIIIDGVELDPSAYRVDDRRFVVRQDGGRWPMCQDLSKPAGEPGTWTFKVFFGREVPALGQLALGELVGEFAKSCGGLACDVPPNWGSISQQGLTINRDQPVNVGDLDTIPEEALPMVRAFLRAFNPNRLNSRSRVRSPDITRPTRTF